MRVLVTGAAGFIGFHTCQALLRRGDQVLGIDNLNDYYDVRLKQARLDILEKIPGFTFRRIDLAERSATQAAFAETPPDRIVHLAAQAGVRYSIDNPHAYGDSNLSGFLNILEGARQHNIDHLVFASSSSVYGANTTMPFSVHQNVDHPLSLYAATKKANELMAHTYAHLYRLPVTGLRFFTVYGPWGRPDMALFKFTKAILANKPIEVYNNGNHARDFTYIDDIVQGVLRTLDHIPKPNPSWSAATPDPATSNAPYRLYNIGNNKAEQLMHLIACIEKALGKEAQKIMLPMQPGDVHSTYADIDTLIEDVGYKPQTSLEEGVTKFIEWYRGFYKN